MVGATGRLAAQSATTPTGRETLRFVQEDVHDFAWTASRRFLERRARFDDPGYPPVDIRLLVQPEHAHLAERYLEATKIALRSYGAWSAPYPYAQHHGGRPGLGLGLRAAWSTRRSSPAAPASSSPPEPAEPRGRHHPRVRATSSGTASWPTTSSRRPGSTRASTATTTSKAADHWPWVPRAGAARYFGGDFGRGGAQRLAGGGARGADRAGARTAWPGLREQRRGGRDGAPGLGVPRRRVLRASTPTASPPSPCRPSRGSSATRP